MPERTVQKIQKLNWHHGKHANRYCIECNIEIWDSFSLKGEDNEYILCKVGSLSDPLANILVIVGKNFRFKTYYYISTVNIRVCRLLLPDELVKNYGVKENQLVDLYLLEVIRSNGTRDKIYPKRLSIGQMNGHPRPSMDVSLPSSNVLIEKEFRDNFYSYLVTEINMAYGYGLHCATLVLVRKIFENLLIDLIRTRYGIRGIELFFWKERGMHHSLPVLIKNVSERIPDFKPYTTAFDDEFFRFLNELKEEGGAGAHSLHVPQTSRFLESRKDKLNYYCGLIVSVIQSIKEGSTLSSS